MRTAGAPETNAAQSFEYAQFAVRNADANKVWFGPSIESYAPQLGDVPHVNRNNGRVTFDRILAENYLSQSGIVIDVAPGKAFIVWAIRSRAEMLVPKSWPWLIQVF